MNVSYFLMFHIFNNFVAKYYIMTMNLKLSTYGLLYLIFNEGNFLKFSSFSNLLAIF